MHVEYYASTRLSAAQGLLASTRSASQSPGCCEEQCSALLPKVTGQMCEGEVDAGDGG